jgi:hypothetical protein
VPHVEEELVAFAEVDVDAAEFAVVLVRPHAAGEVVIGAVGLLKV